MQEEYILDNDIVRAVINRKGAELTKLEYKGKDYMWYADAAYWGRTSPVLFPIVGSINDKTYRYDGKEYHMNQHGFARDSYFDCTVESTDVLHFRMKDNEETYKIYPFHFILKIHYKLIGNTIRVKWIVCNTDDKPMHFSIGAHPAFLCPWDGMGEQKDYQLVVKKEGKPVTHLTSSVIRDGALTNEKVEYDLSFGKLPIDEHLFDQDALVLEGNQTDEVGILAPDGQKYVNLKFDCDVMGIWSPPKKNAPFVCIEPWYGRCDAEGFAGTLEERAYGNTIFPGEEFVREYTIEL